jgi:polyhydroxyalkanoate synthesis regulator phasin
MNRKTQITTIELADLSGKTAKTVQNWANKGKLSHDKDDNGKFLFDLSEIARVFPKINLSSVIDENDGENFAKLNEKARNGSEKLRETGETSIAAVENTFLREKVDDLRHQITDLKTEKAQATAERENFVAIIDRQNLQITGLLPSPNEAGTPKKISALVWLLCGLAFMVAIVAGFFAFRSDFLVF